MSKEAGLFLETIMVSTNHNCNEGEAEGRSSFNILTSQGGFLTETKFADFAINVGKVLPVG